METSARNDRFAFLNGLYQDQLSKTATTEMAGEEQDHIFQASVYISLQFSVVLTSHIHCRLLPIQARKKDSIFQNESPKHESFSSRDFA